jgi:hypothetical protein
MNAQQTLRLHWQVSSHRISVLIRMSSALILSRNGSRVFIDPSKGRTPRVATTEDEIQVHPMTGKC